MKEDHANHASHHSHVPTQPGHSSAATSAVPHSRKFGNPGPLGLSAFALTTFVLSLINVQTRGIEHPNIVIGLAFGYGGLVQLLAGMWEFSRMNMFAATAFSSYGAFWLSYATILVPSSGVIAAYAEDPVGELDNAIGIFLITWFMVTFMFFLVSLRKSVAFIALFGFLSLTFALLAAGAWSAKVHVTKAGGGCGIVTAFVAYYIGFAELLAAEALAPVKLPLGTFTSN